MHSPYYERLLPYLTVSDVATPTELPEQQQRQGSSSPRSTHLETSNALAANAWDEATVNKPKKETSVKAERLVALLRRSTADQNELKDLLWSGVPEELDPCLRMIAWQIMLGYLPAHKERRLQTLTKKRLEYKHLVERYYNSTTPSEEQQRHFRQIQLDLARANMLEGNLFRHHRIQRMMERALYLFAIRHPATGYVQGINEILTPFFAVFLHSSFPEADIDSLEIDKVEEELLNSVEADSYWCFAKVLSDVQDHYIFGQPGIQKCVQQMKDIVKRIDEPLYNHIEQQGLNFLQFSFRWMNCFLIREFPLACSVRLWDTYIAERSEGFSCFHVYVCAVFLVYWSNHLKVMDFQRMMLFLQQLPTISWTPHDIETLLAEAYVLKSLFHPSPRHLGGMNS